MQRPVVLLLAVVLALFCFHVSLVHAQGSVPTGSRLYFPHIANGDQGNGVWQTKFVFVNNSSSTATAELRLFTDTAGAFTVGTNRGSGDRFNISIPPRGTYEIETDGGGSLRTGWGRAFFDHAVIGTAVFSATANTAQGKITSVGVLSTLPKIAFLTPAEANTGIAITNWSTRSQTVELRAFDQSGNQAASPQTITIPAGNHVSRLVREFIPSLSPSFVGSVKLRSLDYYLIALAIGTAPNNVFVSTFSVSAIAYDEMPTGFSGSYSLLNVTDLGTISASNLEHFDSNMFTGTMSVFSQVLGETFTGPFLGNTDDFGLRYTFHFQLSGRPDPGVATADRDYSNDTFTNGFIVDDGQGYYGTFTLTPQAGAGTTVRQQPPLNPRPSKRFLDLWNGMEDYE